MAPVYLKDRIAATPAQRLEMTLISRSPGIISKQKRDGTSYYVHEFTFRSASGEQFKENIWPNTQSGKPNPLLAILAAIPDGGGVTALLNSRGYLEFQAGSAAPSASAPAAPTGAPPTAPLPYAPPPPSLDEMAHKYVLGLHGIVQAQIAAGRTDEQITGEIRGSVMTAEQWILWIGGKAAQMAIEHS